jgi:glucose/arabinose dehydrogenase
VINKKYILLIIALFILSLGAYLLLRDYSFTGNQMPELPQVVTSPADKETTPIEENQQVIMTNLNIPWEIAFLPDGDMLVTERPGKLLRIAENQTVITIEGVRHVGEGGLLGLAVHPDFENNNWIYLYSTSEVNGKITNRVERYKLVNNQLSERIVIIDGIQGSTIHDGGRIRFSPDGYLYITTGDAGNENLAQDRDSLNGKILRLNDDGSIPEDNPFGTPVWTWGHRNPQGLTWDDQGQLWATEHGRSGIRSGYDELNLIEKGKNYGWPVIQGPEEKENMVSPIIQSGPNITWAPAGTEYYQGSIYFAGLRGSRLYEYQIESDNLVEHLVNEYGRLRAVSLNNGYLYLSTSNTDGRGNPVPEDDRIVKVDPRVL